MCSAEVGRIVQQDLALTQQLIIGIGSFRLDHPLALHREQAPYTEKVVTLSAGTSKGSDDYLQCTVTTRLSTLNVLEIHVFSHFYLIDRSGLRLTVKPDMSSKVSRRSYNSDKVKIVDSKRITPLKKTPRGERGDKRGSWDKGDKRGSGDEGGKSPSSGADEDSWIYGGNGVGMFEAGPDDKVRKIRYT